jgi:hypothetical protein
MDSLNIFLIIVVIVLPAILIVILISRMDQNQLHHIQEMKGRELDFDVVMRHPMDAVAKVISKTEKIASNAGGFAKVDLQVEIQLAGERPSRISTCWLVEVDSLDQLLPGKTVSVKLDPKNPLQICPCVPWAKPWVFGN